MRALEAEALPRSGPRPAQVMNYDRDMGDYSADVFIQPLALECLSEHPELLNDHAHRGGHSAAGRPALPHNGE
jgi:hypothetical protein